MDANIISGLRFAIRTILRYIANLIIYYPHYKIFKSRRTFVFRGKKYNYFIHYYNRTYQNERTVEIPIIWEIVKEYYEKGLKILEVGNVLSHYFPVNHDILDKYEKGKGIINLDVVEYNPSVKYDLIVSISTIEHVGYDEKPRDPTKVLKAIENLRNLLKPNGKLIVTIPCGYNPYLDKLIKERKLRFTEMYCLKRISKNEWIEVKCNDLNNVKYNYPYPNANGIIIGIIVNEGDK